MSKATKIREKGKVLSDDVTIYVDGKVYAGWTDLSISKALTSIASSFSLSIIDKWSRDLKNWPLIPGKEIHIHIGKTSIFKGFIEKMDRSRTGSNRSISITGRSRTGDLVECSIVGNIEFKAQKIEQLIQKFCEPFGIKVTTYIDTGKAISVSAVKTSEPVFDFIDTMARRAGFLLVVTPNGNIEITRKGDKRSPTALVQGINLLYYSDSYDLTNRFSEYIVKSQGDSFVSSKGSAKDMGIKRYRPKILIAESSSDSSDVQKRAEWESTFQAAKSLTVKVSVQGWRRSDGTLWTVNELVHTEIPDLGVDGDMLISEIEFSKGSGTIASMSLIRPDAYDPKEDLSEESDPLGGL